MLIEVDNLRVTKLRKYLFDIIQELNEQYKQINVNFLSDDINNYSLDKIPVVKEVESWILGDVVHRDVYNFRSRMNYSADVVSNLENLGFYESFEKIIKENNENNVLPDINGIESIKTLNAGTMVNANTNTAEFSIQVQIEYRMQGEQSINSL